MSVLDPRDIANVTLTNPLFLSPPLPERRGLWRQEDLRVLLHLHGGPDAQAHG